MQKKVVEETASVIPEVRVKIKAAVELLEFELVSFNPAQPRNPSTNITYPCQAATADTEPAENKAKAAKAIADGKALLAATAA